MYRYDAVDQRLVDERVSQFRDQTARFLAGQLTEDQFRPLRLQNGLYVQRLAPMLRVAIPYGVLSAVQLHKLADIARRFDKGYGHFSTRQNIQFNWPTLEDAPEILAQLATVQMHAIQTSGNCVRNTSTDHLAGATADEIVDPRPYCELIRQWSTFHPEFAHLPRKFKIAVNGAAIDRAAVKVHDIGLNVKRNDAGDIGFEVLVGGGLGRTPVIGKTIRTWLPELDLLTYLDAILRVYNLYGRRDNKYKARIKILVNEAGLDKIREEVEAEWARIKDGAGQLTASAIKQMQSHFIDPPFSAAAATDLSQAARPEDQAAFSLWIKRNSHPHRQPGYRAITVSLKRRGVAPGDVTADEMDAIADLAARHSFDEIRVSHEQNVILPHVAESDLYPLWQALKAHNLAQPTAGLISNIIACPGGDFCALANAKSLPIAEDLLTRFDALDDQLDIGDLDLNISGCINSCGHHHVGHIGILGVDKHGEEWYQITLGGHAGNRANQRAALGKVIGRSFARDEVGPVIERIVRRYVDIREGDDERFVDTVERAGLEPFKLAAYGPVGADHATRH